MKTSFESTGGGIVIDLGTGDGRFVSAMARERPDKFFIGIDANVKPLEKPSMRATRNPAKGGLANVMFIQAAVEELPEELDGVADEIHVHFPWGSLLAGVMLGETHVLAALRRIAATGCLLEIVTGIDPVRDSSEIARLGLPELTDFYLAGTLTQRYTATGFRPVQIRRLAADEWRSIETSWARRLGGGDRNVVSLVSRAV